MEACCGGLGKERGGVVGAPGGGVQEGMVRNIESVKVSEDEGVVPIQLGGPAVVGC